MFNKSRKVGIIGVGNVGSHVAYSLLLKEVCDELVLIDKNEEKVKSEMLDLKDAIANSGSNIKIKIQDYSELKDTDILVISAGPLPNFEQTRLDTLDESAKIVDEIIPKVMESGFDGIIIVITNPCDVITYYVYKKSGFPENRVFGTGTSLDSARFKRIMGDILKIDPKSISGYSLGEHGDSQMIPWSQVRIGGRSLLSYIKEKSEFENLDLDKLEKETAYAGWEVLRGKGATCFGIGTATAAIIKSVYNDENSVYTVSACLNGEYGLKGLYMSVPAIIGNSGVKEVIELELPKNEINKFFNSAKVIKKYIKPQV